MDSQLNSIPAGSSFSESSGLIADRLTPMAPKIHDPRSARPLRLP
ncbi:hypothetical protein HMPREF9153_0913 [Cutibacterium avidum ATCC 25577]|uniref:Uncharacterized protein n=1 Tax=Cutibacterium avidum ATCC 25577 TaxID=997355 RepID=G4CWK6_9ACTN|nr:hypothetical protein HMPREF9153_0913 [Cutibacterium avidum ATCC 25577]